MNQAITQTVIASGRFVTSWYQIGPPNGCLPKHTERRVQHVEVYEADFYGRGSKFYARGYSTLERPEYASSQRLDQWDDGDPGRVNECLERIRAAQ